MRRIAPAILALLLAVLVSLPGGIVRADEILDLKLKIIDIQNQGPLGIKNLTLCRKIINFGTYIPLEDNRLEPGATMYVYFEPSRWFTSVNEGRYEFWLNQDVQLLSEAGELLFQQEKLLEMHFNTGQPVLDLFLTNNFSLGELPPGNYAYVVILRDQFTDQTAEGRIDFTIAE